MDHLEITGSSDASRIAGNLWMGSVPPPGPYVSLNFDALVLCAVEYQCPDAFQGVATIAVPLYDHGFPMTIEEGKLAVQAAGRVIKWLAENKKVLVTCHQGRNRSGIVTAIALCKGPAGLTPQQAVTAIRKARGDNAMRNKDFLRFLWYFCQQRSEAMEPGLTESSG